jgi:putative peptide zinc metalloprotease protein
MNKDEDQIYEALAFHRVEGSCLIENIMEARFFAVSPVLYDIVYLYSMGVNKEQIIEQILQNYQKAINQDDISQAVQKILSSIKRPSIGFEGYLIKYTILSHKVTERIARIFKFLMYRPLAITMFTISFLFFLILLVMNYTQLSVDTKEVPNWYLPFFIVLISVLFHEIGHAAACLKFGIPVGEIGFGIYVVIPVFYTDVTASWRLSREKRIVINFAGIYFQSIVAFIYYMLYIGTNLSFFLIGSFLTYISMFINLNPFLKMDGYWILGDYLNIQNLQSGGNRLFKEAIGSLRKYGFQNLSKKEWIVLLYFSVNSLLPIGFLFWMFSWTLIHIKEYEFPSEDYFYGFTLASFSGWNWLYIGNMVYFMITMLLYLYKRILSRVKEIDTKQDMLF